MYPPYGLTALTRAFPVRARIGFDTKNKKLLTLSAKSVKAKSISLLLIKKRDFKISSSF